MEDLTYWQHLIFSIIASGSFAVFLSVPKIDIIPSGIIGGIGWVLYMFIYRTTGDLITPYFLATLAIGFMGNICSFQFKKTALVYVLPGIIPLVPGYSMYYTMFYIVNNDYTQAIQKCSEALFIALSISSAILIMSSLRKVSDALMQGIEESKNKIIKIKGKVLKK